MGIFDDLDDLDFHKKSSGAKKVRNAPVDRPTFPCQTCAGTGKYRAPRVHQPKEHCFACGGKGFFYTSPADRYKKQADAKKRKQAKVDTVREVFLQQHPNFLPLLREAMNFSDFARDLWKQLEAKGAITDAQVAAIERTMAKANATRERKEAEKQEARAAVSAVVDLSPIHAMFDSARKAGLKRLAYRAESLVISPASATSANAGALYLKTESGTYLGKIVGQEFKPTRDATVNTKGALLKIAENPIEAAKAYGKLVGKCSCCGRALTDPYSIENGIGPVCVEKWFGIATPGPTKASVKEDLKAAAIEINTNYGKAQSAPAQKTQDVKTSATKYVYPEGLTDAQKKAYRAKMRKEKGRV